MARKKRTTSKKTKTISFLAWLRRTRTARVSAVLILVLSFGSVGYAAVRQSDAQAGWGRIIPQQDDHATYAVVNVALLDLKINFGDLKGISFNLPYFDHPMVAQDTYRLKFISARNNASKPLAFSHWRLFSGYDANGKPKERIIKTPVLEMKRSDLHSTNIFLIVDEASQIPTPTPPPPKTPAPTTPTRPRPATPPAPIPKQSSSSNSSSSGNKTPSATSNSSSAEKDTKAPTRPDQFTAVIDADTGHVLLSWEAATDNQGVSHYVLERSLDQSDWQVIADPVLYQNYVDSEVDYKTEYFYRLKAVDLSDNNSKYAQTNVTTAPFDANVTVAEGGTFSVEGDWMSVTVPADAVSEDAQCSIVDATEIVPLDDTTEVFAGPYQVVCKTADGTKLEAFQLPVRVQVSLTDEIRDRYRNIDFTALKDGAWSPVNGEVLGDSVVFEIQDGLVLAGTGKVKTTPLIVKVLLVLGGIIIAGLAILYLVYLIYRRRETGRYNAYYRQQMGL